MKDSETDRGKVKPSESEQRAWNTKPQATGWCTFVGGCHLQYSFLWTEYELRWRFIHTEQEERLLKYPNSNQIIYQSPAMTHMGCRVPQPNLNFSCTLLLMINKTAHNHGKKYQAGKMMERTFWRLNRSSGFTCIINVFQSRLGIGPF